jgi:hypothetical protein
MNHLHGYRHSPFTEISEEVRLARMLREGVVDNSIVKIDVEKVADKLLEKAKETMSYDDGILISSLDKKADVADAEGWIEYDGNGKCPVPAGTLTAYKVDGVFSSQHNQPERCWWHYTSAGRITHYRIIKPAAPVRDPAAWIPMSEEPKVDGLVWELNCTSGAKCFSLFIKGEWMYATETPLEARLIKLRSTACYSLASVTGYRPLQEGDK